MGGGRTCNLHFTTPLPTLLFGGTTISVWFNSTSRRQDTSNIKDKKCKIPIVRPPKPALIAVELGPQYHQLTFYKTKMHKGIVRQNVRKNVQSTKKISKYHNRISRDPRGKKCKIPIVRSPNLQYLQWNLHLKIIILHYPTPEFPGILRAKNVRSLL